MGQLVLPEAQRDYWIAAAGFGSVAVAGFGSFAVDSQGLPSALPAVNSDPHSADGYNDGVGAGAHDEVKGNAE